MHDFDFVRVLDFDIFPIFFADDPAIQLDGDALGRQIKPAEKLPQIQIAFDISGFAVDKNFHLPIANLKSKINYAESLFAIQLPRRRSSP